ncbi:MAG: hypothetical protein IGS03_07090 [Candidatus Sericytochromatia bacterium]|nr:hypothetical protein [Candidatus Sericytochromatia bacterium]
MRFKSGGYRLSVMVSGVLASSLLLGACQSPATGGLRFQFAAPAVRSQALDFALQAIPEETERFEIQVTGAGLASPLRAEISLGDSETSVTYTLDAIPTGPKQVRVRALVGSQVLAEASASVLIEGGQTAQAVLELQPVSSAPARLRLSEALPLEIRADLRIQGEGLSMPLNTQITLPAGQQTADLPALPPGSKQIQLVFSTRIEGETVRSVPREENLVVAEDGSAELTIAADELMLTFSQTLDRLLDTLTPAQLLALLAQFREARLRTLFAALPPAVQARILANPRLAALVESLPDALPSVAPVPEVTPEPTAQPAAPNADTLLGDVRLLLTATSQPLLQLREPVEETEATALRMRVLTPDTDHLVFRNTFWALLVRTRYQGDQFIPYGASLVREGESEALWRSNGEIRTAIPFDGQDYLGTAILFNQDQTPLTLEPGRYVLTLNARNPFNQNPDVYRFRILVPPRFGG